MAEVRVNGKELGIVWNGAYRVNVTPALASGDNVLDVKVVNLWVNRQIGDEQLPDDCDRNANGTLKSWPKWFQRRQAEPGRPLYLQLLEALEERRSAAGIRTDRPGDADQAVRIGW